MNREKARDILIHHDDLVWLRDNGITPEAVAESIDIAVMALREPGMKGSDELTAAADSDFEMLKEKGKEGEAYGIQTMKPMRCSRIFIGRLQNIGKQTVYVPCRGAFVPEKSYDTFHVASVSRQDFATIGRDASALTDEQMDAVAERIGDEYYARHFRDDLEGEADSLGLPPLPQDPDEVRGMYARWKDGHTGREPLYATVDIVWKDDGREVSGETVKLNTECSREDSPEDQAIFYYCDGLEELCELLDRDVSGDFRISKVRAFSDELLPS